MHRTMLFAAALLALSAPPALSETFTPAAPLGSTVLDLDTESGNFSDWRIDRLEGINAVRTTLQVHRLGSDPRWAPGFTISLTRGKRAVYFQILGPDRKPPLMMFLAASEDGKKVDEQNFQATVGLDEKIAIAVDWTADGTVTAQVGAEKKTMSLGGPAERLEFAGSTGEAEFNPLQIGHVAP